MGAVGPPGPVLRADEAGPCIGIVCGLRAEVDRARRAASTAGLAPHAVLVGVSGSSSERAGREAERLLAAGAVHLVSFGVAGGLDPALVAGDVIRTSRVGCEGATFGTEGPLVWGAPAVVCDPAAKADLHGRTGAVAVDLESHAVARAAMRAGCPFTVLRAVGDDARSTVPAYLGGVIAPDGRPRLGAVLAGLARRPHTLGALVRLGRDTGRALDAAEAALVELLRSLELLGGFERP